MLDRPLIGITCGTVTEPGQEPRFGLEQEYVRAVESAGGACVVIPPAASAAGQLGILPSLDGLLLPGGADVDPRRYGAERHRATQAPDLARDELEITLLRAAMERGVPVLAICRGQQLVNVALGGTLYQDLVEEGTTPNRHDLKGELRAAEVHSMHVAAESRLHHATGDLARVNSRHHQAIRDVAPALLVTGRGDDGVVEAVETRDGGVVAVQCHPESMQHIDWARRLFADFVETALAYRGRVRGGIGGLVEGPAPDAPRQEVANEAVNLRV
ncbi:MAG: gamma-glutamyl-gamma-aminobutyrate hydrolase family protein [Candidatus Dormibacteria bacterium]